MAATRTRHPKLKGPKPAPPVRCTTAFVDGVGASGHPRNALARVGGLTPERFSALLYAARFSGTPLILQRLTTIADAIYYTGRVVEAVR